MKRWVVRQLSSLLSDYLEGITEQNLQASLSLEVGQVDICHARAQPGLLAERSLRLLSSDVGSVSARIPWRSLGSEPTVITVRDVWVEVQAESIGSATTADEAEEALRRWRARRQRRIRTRVDAARAAAVMAEAGAEDSGAGGAGGSSSSAPQQRRSVAARLGHAALRQLQVRVEGLRIRIHPERARGGAPLELFCDCFALDEGFRAQGNIAKVPNDVRRHPASLDKVLELVGLSAQVLLRPSEAEAAEDSWRDLRGSLVARQLELDRSGRERDTDAFRQRQRELVATKRELQSSVGAPLPVVGPLSLDARLWHSAADGVIWQCVELQVLDQASAIQISPTVARYLCDGLAWYRASLEAPAAARHLLHQLTAARAQSEAIQYNDGERLAQATPMPLSGTEYIELCTKRLRNEPCDESRLQEIEDLAPEDWLIKWQLHCHDQRSMADDKLCDSQPPGTSRGRVPGSRFFRWLTRRGVSRNHDDSSGSGDAESSSDYASEEDSVTAGRRAGEHGHDAGEDEREGEQSIAELVSAEVEEPRRVEIRCVIRQCTIFACRLSECAPFNDVSVRETPQRRLDGGSLGEEQGEVLKVRGGVECCGSATIASTCGVPTAGTIAGLLQASAWDADVNANLFSIAVLLDEEPLLLLQQEESNDSRDCFEDCFEDEEELAAECDEGQEQLGHVPPILAAEEISPTGQGHAARLSVHCARRGFSTPCGVTSSSSTAPAWAVRARLRQEPFRFTLAPRSLRRTLDTVITVARAFAGARAAKVTDDGHTKPADLTLADGHSAQAGTPQIDMPRLAVADGAGGGVPGDSLALDLDLDVAAPVLRWGLLPQGHVTIALGRLRFRTCGSIAPPPMELGAPESCLWRSFSSCCYLTETSVAVQADDSERWVYDPSTICLRAWRETDEAQDGCWQLRVDSEVVRWNADPAVLKAAAQLPLSLDFALSPLREILADAVEAGANASSAAAQGETAHAAARHAGTVSDIAVAGVDATGGSNGDGTGATRQPVPRSQAGPFVRINVCLHRFELICSLSETPSRVSFVTDGIEGQYLGFSRCLEFHSQVAQCELAYEGESVVRCLEGGSLRVRNADQHIAVAGGSAHIEVQWHERRVREVMAAMSEACDCFAAGRDGAQSLLVVGEDSKGTSAQLWSKYVSRPIQARVQRQAATRLKELLPGFERQQTPMSPSTSSRPTLEACSDQIVGESVSSDPDVARAGGQRVDQEAEEVAATEFARVDAAGNGSGAAPAPRGKCSIEVSLAYEGLTATFMEADERIDQDSAPTMQVAVTGAEGGFRGFRSGDGSASVSLLAADLAFRGRRLLTPRRADKLLMLDVVRFSPSVLESGQVAGPATHWTASWAQVCVLFRQRDYDFLSQFVRTSVLGALPTLRHQKVASPPASAVQLSTSSQDAAPECIASDTALAGEEVTVPPATSCFRLDIGAPLVFLPTDRSTLATSRRADDSGSDLSGVGGGELEVDAWGEPGFTPELHDGFLEFDFGHVGVSCGGEGAVPGEVRLQFRGAHVLGACPSQAPPIVVRDLLCPVSLDAVLKSGDGPFEFHATSTMQREGGGAALERDSDDPNVEVGSTPATQQAYSLAQLSERSSPCLEDFGAVPIDHRMSFTRSQLTLILDVLAENICYAGRSAGATLAPANQRPPRHTCNSGGIDAEKKPYRGFKFSWGWPGDLVWDIAFSESAPLVQLRLRNGRFFIDMSSSRSVYGLSAAYFTAADMRHKTRNAVKSLLESFEQPCGEPGFQVRIDMPVDVDTIALIQLHKPVMHVLPQLVLDMVTAGTSAWQHCTFRNDKRVVPARNSTASGYSSAAQVDKRKTRIEVNLIDGGFRIAQKWNQPKEHFEFTGRLLMHFLMHTECVGIERFDLEGGALRLRSPRLAHGHTTLCPCLEWILRGSQKRVDDDARMKRHTTFDLRSVIVPPYSIRMSAQDHRALMGAFAELCTLDADTAEPVDELASRDPLAPKLVENRITISAEASIQGAEVQILGVEGGHAWPGLKFHMRCPLLEAIVDIRTGAAPTVNLFAKELELDLQAHNHRLGLWEPVLPVCLWKLVYHMQRKPDGGPREVSVRGQIVAGAPVRLVICAPFIHLAARVFRADAGEMRYGHLLAGVNISGIACRASVEGTSEECIMSAETQVQPLDGLLKGSGRGGQMVDPCLELSVVGEQDGKTCRVPLGRESCIPWNTGASGWLLCRLIMPRPPQILLLISSTVVIRNLTATDLEVRFLSARRDSSSPGSPSSASEVTYIPIMPHDALRSVDASCLSADWLATGASTIDEAKYSNRSCTCGPDGALRLSAGQLLSAPPEAQIRIGQVVLQLRPAPETAGGITYDWSDSFLSVPASGPGNLGVTVCSSPPPGMRDMPRHWLHVQTSGGSPEEGWNFVDVQAPFTIINACPCDAFCRLNPPLTSTLLGIEKSNFTLASRTDLVELIVFDGRGGEIRVPPGGQVEVFPLRLDADRYFHWKCNGNKERLRSRWPLMNCLTVVLDARNRVIEWHCRQAAMDMGSSRNSPAALRISAQSSLPVFDSIAEEIRVSFALRDAMGTMTSWSLPVYALPTVRSVEEVIELEHRGMYVRLKAYRRGRELLLYSKWWFVNSTGLDVQLVQRGGPGPLHPVPSFGGQAVSFLPEDRNEAGDGVAHVQLRNNAHVTVRVPDLGGSELVDLTRSHPCCLRTESIAMPEAMSSVSCCLVSLLPCLLLFNKTDMQIGFRLSNPSDRSAYPNDLADWVAPGASNTLWGSGRAERSLQISARSIFDHPASGGSTRQTDWSGVFEIKETHIGAFPVTLKCGQGSGVLVCVCIDQDAAVFSVTIRDSSCCHTLVNTHRGVTLDARMEGTLDDPAYLFTVAHSQRVGFAGRGPTAEGGWNRLRLVVRSVADPLEKAGVVVHLNRAGLYKVPLAANVANAPRVPANRPTPKSTLRSPTLVQVELRNRVAVVTVREAADVRESPDGVEETTYTIQGELRVDLVTIALLTEGVASSSIAPVMGTPLAFSQRSEAFTVSLIGVNMLLDQTPSRRRDISFEIREAQIDLQGSNADVVFRSTTQPFLQTKTQRDDCSMLDLHLRHASVALGEVELSVTDAAWEHMRLLRKNLSTGTGGLAVNDVLERAMTPYHLVCEGPPASSSKLVVRNLEVGIVRVTVWCEIYLPDAHYVPRSLRDSIQMASFGTNHLQVKGAHVQVPKQTFFSDRCPGEGSMNAVLARVSAQYLPHVKACWRSLLQHSNIFLGGFFSRAVWMPRQRQSCKPRPPVCRVSPAGELTLVAEGRPRGGPLHPVAKAASQPQGRFGMSSIASSSMAGFRSN